MIKKEYYIIGLRSMEDFDLPGDRTFEYGPYLSYEAALCVKCQLEEIISDSGKCIYYNLDIKCNVLE